jgi:hypothetical protein
MTEQYTQTRLKKADLTAIEAQVQMDMAAMGIDHEPTIADLQAEGYTENRTMNAALAWISGAGRVITLFIAEFIQAFAAIALAVVFIALEAERITSGVVALGQHQEQAVLIAVAFTVANVVTPIYRLRNLRGRASITRHKWTVRGHLAAFWRKLTAQPQAYEVDVYDNPTLSLAEAAITWATLFLAFYAVLGPQLEAYQGETWYSAIGAIFTRSSLTEMMGLAAGALLAFGGVFGVQSIAHEIGVRTLTDQPARLSDLLEQRKAERLAQIEAIRERAKADYMAAKIADEQRAKGGVSVASNGHTNGNGHHEETDFLALPATYPNGNHKN